MTRELGVCRAGLKGSFCAPPCLPRAAATCADCPAACQIKNRTTGQCAYCDSHPSHHPGDCKVRAALPALLLSF